MKLSENSLEFDKEDLFLELKRYLNDVVWKIQTKVGISRSPDSIMLRVFKNADIDILVDEMVLRQSRGVFDELVDLTVENLNSQEIEQLCLKMADFYHLFRRKLGNTVQTFLVSKIYNDVLGKSIKAQKIGRSQFLVIYKRMNNLDSSKKDG